MGVPYSLFGGGGSNSKRPHEDSDDDEADTKRIPARKKLKTADYIYEQLFVKGCGSDVTVRALDKEWNLHKIYLSQSSYFSSMFNGNWVESRQKCIHMSVPNSVITIKSLDQAFGSLYHDEIDIDCDEVINLVAAATLLQLDCLVSQCADVMLENIRLKYVISYYISSKENGLSDVREACLKWLRTNLLRVCQSEQLLRNISKNLLTYLISSNELCVYQGEVDVYYLLKKWLYVKCEQEVAKSSKKNIPSLKSVANAWLSDFKGKKRSFLETVSGVKFASVFSALRLQNILALEKSVHVIIDDNIIPRNITDQYLALKWQMQLCIENENKTDDSNEEPPLLKEIDPTFFYKCAIRCGRDLAQDVPINWRWTGYNHGIDILISHRYRIISMQRNCNSFACPYSVNMKDERTIYYKLNAHSCGLHRKVVWSSTTGIQKVVMKPDSVKVILRIPTFVNYPITLSFWYSIIPANRKAKSIVDQYAEIWSKFLVTLDDTADLDDSHTVATSSLDNNTPSLPETLDA